MKDYIPRNDVEFRKWLEKFITTLEAHAADFAMDPSAFDTIKAQNAAFDADISRFIAAQKAAKSAVASKRDSRAAVEATARFLSQWANHHPAMTDGLRSTLGLRPRNLERDVIPISRLRPIILLRASLGEVAVHWGPNPGNEWRNGKPAGVWSCNIYRKRSDEEDFRLVGYTSSSPYRDPISGPAADYTYVVRYRGRKAHQLSVQSDTATIAARGAMQA